MPQKLPDATAQKQAAVEVFAQYEPPLYEAYLEMMLEWLAAVKTAMFAGGVARLHLVPDPLKVFSQTPKWHTLTEQYTAKVAEDVLAAPYRDLFADGTLFESRPFVRNWIADRANRLQRVPDEVYGHVATIIDSATTNGATIPDVTEQVEKLFDATDVQTWKNRARTVARTEVVGAYNGGLHDAFAMVAENDPGTAYVHRWLATDDQRTRPDHREADGQVRPWGQPFDVGGFAMMHPHDPAAPPQEVINCRCTELMEVAGEPTRMDNRQYLGASITLMQAACTTGEFCLQTHKPGLCKGQHRGGYEPGQQDANKGTPAARAQIAVKGLNTAIAQAQAVEAANAVTNPKLAAMARRAVSGYQRALKPHQQTLKDAARTNKQAQRQGQRDTREQDSMDKRAQRQKDTLKRRADAIIARRKEKAKLAKMSPHQRAAYHKAKAKAAAKQRAAQENKTLKDAARA
jgi:hypothetical protein